MKRCVNCHSAIHTPDDRTGLIHKDGFYSCRTTVTKDNGDLKVIRLETVAEDGEDVADMSMQDIDDHSGHSHAEFIFGTVCLI